MSSPKIPSPIDAVVATDGLITQPWYQYFMGSDPGWRTPVAVITTASTASNIYQGQITVMASTPGVTHVLEDPEIGFETVIICNIPTTQAGSITVAAATDVAIGPSGENALVFGTSASTYEHIKLVGTSTSQYHILHQTTNVSVAASS
jgi:hypothetical protein